MAFKWDSYFETGIAIVDQQHRGLVDLINEVAPLLAASVGLERARLELLMDRLFNYADVHFKTEEALMRKHGLISDYCTNHKEKHAAFVNQLIEMRTMMGQASHESNGPTLLRFLTSWLTFHILDEDQRMARQIQFVEQGGAPEQAHSYSSGVVSQNDHARAALVSALLDLYEVFGERNRILVATNEKLKRVSAELEESNRALEGRVEARTHELREALERMERTQSQLMQSEKMAAIGQLAAGVAHEINNPVGFVNSNLGTLKKYVQQLLNLISAYEVTVSKLPLPEDGQRQIEQARQQADIEFLRQDVVDLIEESAGGLERVRKIVQDLKDFSHVDNSEWQDTDINAGLESTINVIWNELKYKAEVVRNYGELPLVPCVAAQINQVFMNLLVNAVQAIETHGKITVTTGADERIVWVEISDTGAGMPQSVQEHIFEPFFTTKPVGTGTGLGLSISWDTVVKKHGGQLSVTSQVGHGTCFRIELPRHSPVRQASTT